MPLLKDGRITADEWIEVRDDAPLPDGAPAIVSLARWQRERTELARRTGRLGLRLPNNASVADIAPDLGRFELIALDFPKFSDGRAYSQARLLRERHGFAGEIRATGAVLRDQLLFMQRCGMDAFIVRDEQAAEAWRRASGEIGVFYQPTGDGRETVRALRRHAAG